MLLKAITKLGEEVHLPPFLLVTMRKVPALQYFHGTHALFVV